MEQSGAPSKFWDPVRASGCATTTGSIGVTAAFVFREAGFTADTWDRERAGIRVRRERL